MFQCAAFLYARRSWMMRIPPTIAMIKAPAIAANSTATPSGREKSNPRKLNSLDLLFLQDEDQQQ